MGREEAKEQSKEAQRAKETAAFEKKQAQRDKQWQVGAKDSSSQDEAAAKAAEAAARKAERKAIEEAEGAGGMPNAGTDRLRLLTLLLTLVLGPQVLWGRTRSPR
jgi:hypothetical protein